MAENSTQNNPTEQTKNHPEETKRKRLRPVWLTDVILVYICGGLVIVLLACGAALLNSHPKPVVLAWTTMLAAIIVFGLGTRFWLINHRKKQTKNKIPEWVPNVVCLVFAILGLSFWVYAVCQEKRESPPHLSLVLMGTNAFFLGPESIPLTDKRLIFSKRSFSHSNILGVIAIPLEYPFTNACLRFAQLNDSSVPIDAAVTIAQMPLRLECRPSTDPSWEHNWKQWPQPQPQKMQSFVFEARGPLLPGTAGILPDLNFPQTNVSHSEAFPIVMQITAKGIPLFQVAFMVTFYPCTNSASGSLNPKLIWPSDLRHSTGNDIFRLPLEKL